MNFYFSNWKVSFDQFWLDIFVQLLGPTLCHYRVSWMIYTILFGPDISTYTLMSESPLKTELTPYVWRSKSIPMLLFLVN